MILTRILFRPLVVIGGLCLIDNPDPILAMLLVVLALGNLKIKEAKQ